MPALNDEINDKPLSLIQRKLRRANELMSNSNYLKGI